MIKYSEIKYYEPCFLNRCIFATLKTGKKIKIKLTEEGEEFSFSKFVSLIEIFKSKMNRIKNNFSTKKTRLLYVTEEGEKYTCKQICKIMNWNRSNFQKNIAKNGEYRGIKFSIENIVREKIKKERKKRITYVRTVDNKEMTLKEICTTLKVNVNSARKILEIYGELKGVCFRIFRCGEEIKPLKTKRKVFKYKMSETGEVDTVSNFAKKYNWNVERLRTVISARKKYKGYTFTRIEEREHD